MLLEELPNELLAEIFEKLTFVERIHCSITCNRFHDLIMKTIRKSIIDEWRLGQAPQGHDEGDYGHIVTADDIIISLHKDGADLFDCHPYSPKVFRTERCESEVVRDTHLAAIMPTTSTVVFTTGPAEMQLAGYCIRARKQLFQIEIEIQAYEIHCSTSCIAIAGVQDLVWQTVLYRVNGSSIVLTDQIRTVSFPSLSANGILAYMAEPSGECYDLKLFDTSTRTDITSFSFQNRINCIRIDAAARFIAVDEDFSPVERFLTLYDIARGCCLFQFSLVHPPNPKLEFGWMKENVFSVCARFVLLKNSNCVTIFDLQKSSTKEPSFFIIELQHFISSTAFRDICGVPHVMLFDNRLLLSVYKFDEATGNWTALE